MIQKAWSFWYMEQGSLAREAWRWRRANLNTRYASVVEALGRFDRSYAKYIGKVS